MCYFTCPFTTPNSNSHSQQKNTAKISHFVTFTQEKACLKPSIDYTFFIYLCGKSFLSVLSIKLQYFYRYCGAGFGVGEGVVVVC